MDFFKSIKTFSDRLRDIIQGTSKISVGGNLEGWDLSEVSRTSLEDLEKLYLSNPFAFQGINLIANAILGRGYYIETDNKQAEAICKHVISLPSFKTALLDSITQTLIYGVSFQEIIWNGRLPVRFKTTDPKTFKIKWNDYGEIQYYEQRIQKDYEKPIKFERDQIIFFRFFRASDLMYGIGFLEPLKQTLEIEADVSLSIKEAIKRFANPPIHIIKKGASKTEIEALRDEFKDFNRNTFLGTSERYEINVIPLYKRFPDLEWQIDYLISKICTGLRVPRAILLGRGDVVNRATLDSLIDHNQDEIRHIQEKISRILEEQLISEVLKKNNIIAQVQFKWYPLVTEDERQKTEIRHLDIDSILRIYGAELIDREEAKQRILKLFED